MTFYYWDSAILDSKTIKNKSHETTLNITQVDICILLRESCLLYVKLVDKMKKQTHLSKAGAVNIKNSWYDAVSV